MDRSAAIDRIAEIVEAVSTEGMPVPVRQVWVYGDVALGLDPVERLDVYLAKDVLLRDDRSDRARALEDELGVRGIGRTVRTDWAETYPEHVRANDNGHVAPEKCLAAHLLRDGEPIHLEVCNTGFEDNVTQRLEGALARGAYEQVLDPRGACLWIDGRRSDTAFEKLRDGDLVFPTLPEALSMLGADEEAAAAAAEVLRADRADQEGVTVRGDVI